MSVRLYAALVLALVNVGPPAGPMTDSVPAPAPFARLRVELERLVTDGTLTSAAVGVIRRGHVEWAQAFGLADRAAGIPATVDTPYGIASMGKAMTATAVMTLVESGRLRLDSRVDEVLGRDAIRVLDGNRTPTVRELLDMTAGIPHGALTYRVPDHPSERDLQRQRAAVVFPPGEVFHYSNFSIAVADAVVEAVSGRSFAEYLHERVFAPLQMTHSSLGAASQRPTAARRYDAEGKAQADARFPRSSRQMQASLMDLLKFAAFQLGTPLPGQRPVLSSGSIGAMQQERSSAPGAHVALGIGSLDIGDGQRWIISSGNDIGVQSHLTLLPHAGLGVAVLLNDSGDSADEWGIRIADAAVSGFAERAMAAARAHQARTGPFDASPDWAGEWTGDVATADGPTPVWLGIEAAGGVRIALGTRLPVGLEETRSRDGTLTGSFTARLPLDELPDGDHRVELTMRRHGDRLTGFLLANFRTARGKFEMPVPVVLQRSPQR